jgi:hypothetical protein
MSKDRHSLSRLPAGQVLHTGEQQPPVYPDRVPAGAAATQLLAGGALPDLGDHLVASATSCQMSTAN